MGGLGKVREYRADRHREGAGRAHDGWRLPPRIRHAKGHPLRRVEATPHRVDAFGPILVQDEFAEPRVALEGQPEQILRFALVPIEGRSMDKPAH